MRETLRRLRSTLPALLLVGTLIAPHTAAAQDAGGDPEPAPVVQTPNPVTADFKGMIGLGLIGAELGFVVPALSGARETWHYIVFPILGAGAGAAGGYFLLEDGAGEPELAVASLTLGMALIVPTMVITLSATAYDPETDELSGRLPARVRAAREAGPGLLRVSERGVMLAPPAIVARRSVSQAEALRTGASADRELSVAVMSGRF